jgi:hypothetical protein
MSIADNLSGVRNLACLPADAQIAHVMHSRRQACVCGECPGRIAAHREAHRVHAEEVPAMSEPLYRSRSTIETRGPLHRHARLPAGGEADFGVHGPIQEYFKLTPDHAWPLPVDYIVAATGG